MAQTLFSDEAFIDRVVSLLAHDAKAIHTMRPLLSATDFKPLKGAKWGNQRWVVADRCLQYYDRFHQPVGPLLRADILEYANGLQLSERQVASLDEYLVELAGITVTHAEAVVSKVTTYKLEHARADVLQELAQTLSAGQMDDAKWTELFQRGLLRTDKSQAIDYFNTLDSRMDRRDLKWRHSQIPCFMIEPLDAIVQPPLGPKQLGLILAPTSRGKSLFLIWLALHYVLQYCHVLFITLEDALEEVETRLDSAVTRIPYLQLETRPAMLRDRFESYRRLVNAGLHIVDGTEEKYTVAMIERTILDQRERGFLPHVLIVDYDDYLVPATPSRDRRQDIDAVYRDLKRLGAQYNLITWTAAQTQRNTSSLKILVGDKVADDIGKLRKSTMTISMGKGEIGEGSLFLYVAKHKFGQAGIGCNIMPNLEEQVIYDNAATIRALRATAASVTQNEEEEFGS